MKTATEWAKRVQNSKEPWEKLVQMIQDDARASLWQPIETAPKDGTLVMLWIADGGDRRTGAMEKGHVYEFGAQAIGYHGNWKITHWQPLPEPPKGTDK